MAYRVLTWFLRVVTRVFFRQIEVVGLENVPREGPVLFAGNHPNSLIDPILIITTNVRKVHFAAKDTLFKGRLMRAILNGLGAVPIARRSEADGGAAAGDAQASGQADGQADGLADGKTRDAADMARVNDAAFEHMYRVLATGGTIGIFPEGISHDESQLAKLKTGAARLALGGADRAQGPIAIVPCGLTFIHPKRFRSRVLVQYGPPIFVESLGSAEARSVAEGQRGASIERSAEPTAVKAVTADIDRALRRLTINAPDWETVRALDTVRRLYQPPDISIEDRIELARRFNTHYPAVAGDPRVVELMGRVRAYQAKLDELGLADRELAHDLSKREIGTRMLRHLVLIAWWLPLTIPSAPLHVPPLVFARVVGPRLTPRKDVIATTKMLVGMLLVVLSYAIAIGYVWWTVGTGWALATAALILLSGWATVRVLDRLYLVQRAFGTLGRRFRFRREVEALRAERTQLAADVIQTVTACKPVDLEQMFPPEKR